MTRHWIEGNLNEYGAGFDLICEHPTACSETVEGERLLGCCVKDFFDDMGTDLFDDMGSRVPLGRIEVSVHWRGSDEDTEVRLEPTGPQLDWHRIAVQIARYGGSYYGLKTWERDALEAEVAAENERDWGTEHERRMDAADRGEA